MKKICLFLSLVIIFLCGCLESPNKKAPQKTDSRFCGVWLTYSELDNALSDNNFKENFTKIADNCKDFGITDMFIHTVPFMNSYYKSDILPSANKTNPYSFDVFSYMTNICHQRNIKVHAWLNPYRVRTADSDINKVDTKSPAFKWLNDSGKENDLNVIIRDGIYLNPVCKDVQKLITDIIREIIEKYPVDGIHFDDYFYPYSSPDFDKESYEKYRNETKNPLSLEDFRRTAVTSLISSVYSAVKYKNSSIIFSISPAASIEKNRSELFADISYWCQNGLIDMIIPQLYFGFDYPDSNFQFEKLLKDWKAVTDKTDIRLSVGLATYKIGTSFEPDKEEWTKGYDVILKQTLLLNSDKDVMGEIFFSYSSLFSEEKLTAEQRAEISKQLK